MEINIPESMKKNEKWVREEKAIYDRFLHQILETHEKQFRKERRIYDRELALYIR